MKKSDSAKPLSVDDIFDSKEAIKRKLTEYGLSVNRRNVISISNKGKLYAKCNTLECSFKFNSRLRKDGMFHVNKFSHHDCFASTTIIRRDDAVPMLEDIVLDAPCIKPKSGINIIRRKHGLETKYHTVYRSMRKIKEKALLYEEKEYNLLKPFLEWQKNNNFGTVTDLETNNDNRMEYVFLAPWAWALFLSNMQNAFNLLDRDKLVVLSDREKGIINALSTTLPNAAHSFCVFHIEKNIKTKFKRSTNGLIWKASKALNVEEFENTMKEIENNCYPISEYLRNIPSSNWATAFFPFPRYGHVTSNIAESSNAWINDLRYLSPLGIILNYMRKLTDLLIRKDQQYQNLNLTYDKKIEQNLKDFVLSGRQLSVYRTTNKNVYEVQIHVNSNLTHIVNIENKTCTCDFIVENGYPCRHICAVCEKLSFDIKEYVSKELLVQTLKLVYNGEIRPVCLLKLKPESLE